MWRKEINHKNALPICISSIFSLPSRQLVGHESQISSPEMEALLLEITVRCGRSLREPSHPLQDPPQRRQKMVRPGPDLQGHLSVVRCMRRDAPDPARPPTVLPRAASLPPAPQTELTFPRVHSCRLSPLARRSSPSATRTRRAESTAPKSPRETRARRPRSTPSPSGPSCLPFSSSWSSVRVSCLGLGAHTLRKNPADANSHSSSHSLIVSHLPLLPSNRNIRPTAVLEIFLSIGRS